MADVSMGLSVQNLGFGHDDPKKLHTLKAAFHVFLRIVEII